MTGQETDISADALGQIIFRLETNFVCVQRRTSLPTDLVQDITRDIERLKAFKQALGKLYKSRRINFLKPGIQLLDNTTWSPGG